MHSTELIEPITATEIKTFDNRGLKSSSNIQMVNPATPK